MAKKKIAVIGVGKIAQDQHLPVIDKSPDFELAACISTRADTQRGTPANHRAALGRGEHTPWIRPGLSSHNRVG